MVLLEAMYFGTPVITYKAAGPIDVIKNGVDGIVMDNFEVNQWADKIFLHVVQKNDCKIMGEKGMKKIINNYLWSKVADDYIKKYMEIINN